MRWSIWLLAGLLVVLMTACDEVPADTTAPVGVEDNEPVLSLPTRTLGPIVSFTPRFTATPIPSITYTPSDTPTPTWTPVPATLTFTPSPTPTPTVSGVVRSTENVNLREGPGTNFPIVSSVNPGTEIGVLGILTDDSGREWYKIAYTTEDGEVQLVWVFANLIETDFQDVVGSNATPPPASAVGITGTPRPTPEPNRVEILAYCLEKNVRPARPTTSDNVYVEWSWFVAREELMQQHLDNANYNVTLDGELLDDWEQYATEMRLEQGVYIIYWYYPVGRLEAGAHRIEYELTWDEAITDGYEDFGPDTPNVDNSGSCEFSVIEP